MVLELLKKYRNSDEKIVFPGLFHYFIFAINIDVEERPYDKLIEFNICLKDERNNRFASISINDNQIRYSCSIDPKGYRDSIIFSDMITYAFKNEFSLLSARGEEFDNLNQIIKREKEQKMFDDLMEKALVDIENEEIANSIAKAHIFTYVERNRGYINVEFKVGRDKEYKIPSLKKFIDRFKYKESYQYGKNFNLIHIRDSFDEISQKLIDILEKEINKYAYYEIDVRKVLKSILNNCPGYIISVDVKQYLISNETIKPIIFVDKTFHMHVEKIPDDNQLIDDFYIDGNSIKKIEGGKRIFNLIEAIKSYPNATIENNIDKYKYYFFKKYPDIFSLDESIAKIIDDNDLIIRSYFDYDNGSITISYKYIKDNDEVNYRDISTIAERTKIDKFQKTIANYGFIDGIMIKHEDVYNFLFGSIESLKEVSEVYLSETLSLKRVSFTTPQISIRREGNLLDIIIEKSDYSDEELIEIFNSIKKKKKFFLLRGNIINLSNENALDFYTNFSELELVDKKKINKHKQVPLYFAFKINNDEINNDAYLHQLITDVKDFSSREIDSIKIDGELRNYQLDGVKWLNVLYYYNLGGVLADDMGLGKTIETIAFIKLVNPKAPILIVAPKSLTYNWLNEFHKFAKDIPVTVISGTANERDKIINKIDQNKQHVYLISYDSLRLDIDKFKDIKFDICILDEAQYIKNIEAKKTDAVKKINSSHNFALTGTPIENTIYDLWSIFDFLMPNYLLPFESFKENVESNEKYMDIVKNKVAPFILRRRKMDVLKDLPDKIETVYSAEMTTNQRKVYDAFRLQAREQMSDENANTIQIFALLTRLRQLCVDPSLFIENYQGGSGKIDLLINILEENIPEGHRFLIFSQFVSIFEKISHILSDLNIGHRIITGETDAKERLSICDEFNSDEHIKVVLISLKAGGTGLNLIGADKVIHLDPWWNIAATDQASDRAHRIGQTRNVEIIKLICEKSIEQRVIDLQNEKKNLVDKVIAENENSIKNLSVKDFKELLKM